MDGVLAIHQSCLKPFPSVCGTKVRHAGPSLSFPSTPSSPHTALQEAADPMDPTASPKSSCDLGKGGNGKGETQVRALVRPAGRRGSREGRRPLSLRAWCQSPGTRKCSTGGLVKRIYRQQYRFEKGTFIRKEERCKRVQWGTSAGGLSAPWWIFLPSIYEPFKVGA